MSRGILAQGVFLLLVLFSSIRAACGQVITLNVTPDPAPVFTPVTLTWSASSHVDGWGDEISMSAPGTSTERRPVPPGTSGSEQFIVSDSDSSNQETFTFHEWHPNSAATNIVKQLTINYSSITL